MGKCVDRNGRLIARVWLWSLHYPTINLRGQKLQSRWERNLWILTIPIDSSWTCFFFEMLRRNQWHFWNDMKLNFTPAIKRMQIAFFPFSREHYAFPLEFHLVSPHCFDLEKRKKLNSYFLESSSTFNWIHNWLALIIMRILEHRMQPIFFSHL